MRVFISRCNLSFLHIKELKKSIFSCDFPLNCKWKTLFELGKKHLRKLNGHIKQLNAIQKQRYADFVDLEKLSFIYCGDSDRPMLPCRSV